MIFNFENKCQIYFTSILDYVQDIEERNWEGFVSGTLTLNLRLH